MSVAFDDQVNWVRAEAQRIRDTFGSALALEAHLDNPVWGEGTRVMTIWDPANAGTSAAVCVTEASAEGGSWRVELRPLLDGVESAVPDTKAISVVDLEIRYGRCVHASGSEELGRTSGEGGKPDLNDGIEQLIAGTVKVSKKRSFGGKTIAPYAAV